MKATLFVIAASAMGLASAAQARMPVFLEYEGVKGESAGARSAPRAGSTVPTAQPDRRVSGEQPQPIRQAQLKVRKCGDCNALNSQVPDQALHRGASGAPAADTPPPPPPPRMAKNSRTVIRIDHHDPEASRSGVNVAAGDVNGDGRAEAALLLPAVQKVRVADDGADPVPATSTQGPYKRQAPAIGQQAPRDIAAPRPAPQPLLVPAVQKPGVGSRRVAPRPQNPPPPPPK